MFLANSFGDALQSLGSIATKLGATYSADRANALVYMDVDADRVCRTLMNENEVAEGWIKSLWWTD